MKTRTNIKAGNGNNQPDSACIARPPKGTEGAPGVVDTKVAG